MAMRVRSKRTQSRRMAAMLTLGLCAALFALSGCKTAQFYRQAVRGQWRILVDREPIKDLIARPTTPERRRAQLALVLRLREFAESELRLPHNGHYLSFVELGRPHLVWNVHAAREFSVDARTWWYPFVGSLEYRGYFAEADARRYGATLAHQGWDVCVEPVDAYSTLGWLRDPVLSSFIDYAEPDLAGLLFHELAHQKLFVAGDTDFNEAFATAVEREGVRRWLRRNQDPAALDRYEVDVAREERWVTLVLDTRRRLKELYTQRLDEPANASPAAGQARIEALRQKKEAVFADLRAGYARVKESHPGDSRYDRWFARPLNNAHLNTVDAYHGLLPGFERLLRRVDGRLDQFYAEVKRLGKLPKEERQRRLLETGMRDAPGDTAPAQQRR